MDVVAGRLRRREGLNLVDDELRWDYPPDGYVTSQSAATPPSRGNGRHPKARGGLPATFPRRSCDARPTTSAFRRTRLDQSAAEAERPRQCANPDCSPASTGSTA